MTVDVAQELRHKYAAMDPSHSATNAIPVKVLLIIRYLSAQVPIKMNNINCAGKCSAKVNVRYVRPRYRLVWFCLAWFYSYTVSGGAHADLLSSYRKRKTLWGIKTSPSVVI